jgi:hypothetical protein
VADDYSPASNTVVYPEQGLIIRRRAAGNVTLTSSGPLKQGPTTVPVLPGVNLLGLYHRPTAVRLDDLGLPNAGFVAGPNADVGDNLRVFNAQGLMVTYFYSNLPGFEGWLDFSYQPAGQLTLAPGSVFILYRRPPNPPLDWTIPAQ